MPQPQKDISVGRDNDGREVTSKNITRESTLGSCDIGFPNQGEGITGNFIGVMSHEGGALDILECQNNDGVETVCKTTPTQPQQVLKCDNEHTQREKEMPDQERKIIPHVGSNNGTPTIIVKKNKNVL